MVFLYQLSCLIVILSFVIMIIVGVVQIANMPEEEFNDIVTEQFIKIYDVDPLLYWDDAIEIVRENVSFEVGNGKIEIQPGEKESYEQSNDYSLIVTLEYGEKSFLFMGDAEEIRTE